MSQDTRSVACSIQGAPSESVQRLETGITVGRAETAVSANTRRRLLGCQNWAGPFTVEDAKAQGGKKTCPPVMAANTVCTLSQGQGAPSSAGNHGDSRKCVLPPTTPLSAVEQRPRQQ